MFSVSDDVSGVVGIFGVLGYDGGVFHEVFGDDAVEDEEDAEWDDEEDCDGEDEEEGGPEGVSLGEADGDFGAVVVTLVGEGGYAEDGAAKKKIMVSGCNLLFLVLILGQKMNLYLVIK